jgi:hypothetical protein
LYEVKPVNMGSVRENEGFVAVSMYEKGHTRDAPRGTDRGGGMARI